MNNFSLFGQIQKEIQDFRTTKIHIAGTDNGEQARYLTTHTRGYQFSQWETVNLIDLYYNSKFETGNIDSEGQRKLFLNICAFRSDVASKMVDLDTKDFVFIPEDEGSKWGAYFIQREFKDWAKTTYFGEFINELVENYPRYGTVVTKKVGNRIERVPLMNLVNQQDAKDLQTATHVIEVHEDMTLDDMRKYPDWDLSGIDMEFGETTTVYERYGKVPASYYYAYKGTSVPRGTDDDDGIDVVAICTVKQDKKGNAEGGSILFMEKIGERPYREAHWKRQDGRWLGIGEVENQFENQISRNMIANLRRRALLWSSKKVFQSPDDTIARNLVRDVKDGDVIRIMPNGNITQVDMASREVGEFNSAEQMWEQNSDQKSFTFEVATGEAMPSGTPFRMGVILSNAVNSHFGMKKEKLGLFLKRLIVEDVFEIFKKENRKEHVITIFGDAKGMQDLRNVIAEQQFNDIMFKAFMSENIMPDPEAMKQQIDMQMSSKPELYIRIPDSFYDQIKHRIELVITGEEMDVSAKIATYTTLYQSLAQQGDPRAEMVLSKIGSLSGENFDTTVGSRKPQPQQQQVQAQQPQPSPLPMPNAAQPQQV